MSSVVSRPTSGSRAVLFLGAAIALSVFVFSARTGAHRVPMTGGDERAPCDFRREPDAGERRIPTDERLGDDGFAIANRIEGRRVRLSSIL